MHLKTNTVRKLLDAVAPTIDDNVRLIPTTVTVEAISADKIKVTTVDEYNLTNPTTKTITIGDSLTIKGLYNSLVLTQERS